MNTMKKNRPLEQWAHFSLLISNLQIAAASPATHACAHTRQRYRAKKKKMPRKLISTSEPGFAAMLRARDASVRARQPRYL